MVKNAYIHIPFCKSKCNYCSFVSFDMLNLKEKYLDALKLQIETKYKKETLETLYFGGGTPSLLTISELFQLISLFHISDSTEITVEVNPDSVSLDYLSKLRKLGVNRLSIGSQTFDDDILKLIGRRHNSMQIFESVDFAKKAGFNNISLDFIYGLPNQTIHYFKEDLKNAVKLDITHISLYGLKIDEGCYFYNNKPENIADSDIQADMYLGAIEILEDAGFEHYEISNFAKKSFESKHNLNYWEANTYYGFGCAASGYVDNVRYTNEIDLKKYIKNPLVECSKQELSQQEKLEESIFLGLRKMSGLNIRNINEKFDIDFNNKYLKLLEKYSEFFIKTEQGYAFNSRGILVSNEILAEFIE